MSKPLLVCPVHGEVPWDEVCFNSFSLEPYHFCGKDLEAQCICIWKNARERSVVDACCKVHGHSEPEWP